MGEMKGYAYTKSIFICIRSVLWKGTSWWLFVLSEFEELGTNLNRDFSHVEAFEVLWCSRWFSLSAHENGSGWYSTANIALSPYFDRGSVLGTATVYEEVNWNGKCQLKQSGVRLPSLVRNGFPSLYARQRFKSTLRTRAAQQRINHNTTYQLLFLLLGRLRPMCMELKWRCSGIFWIWGCPVKWWCIQEEKAFKKEWQLH